MFLEKIKDWFRKKGPVVNSGQNKDFETGVVKRVYRSKGYGFIVSGDNEKPIFVHFTDALAPLKVGNKVKFRVKETQKGLRATEVQVID